MTLEPPSRARELRDFIVHLRLHYQLLILPAGYLLGGLFQPSFDAVRFILQFFNVHVLLNGGVTVYNSFWDKDEGPIGGIEKPPPLAEWTHPASLVMQLLGAVLAYPLGPIYLSIWASTMILSIFYSHPRVRWKGHPLLSLVAVGIGTGTNTFLLGYLAAGEDPLDLNVLIAAIGVASALLSLYPISQIYQLEADKKHGDRTFAAAFGVEKVKVFFFFAYVSGIGLVAFAISKQEPLLAKVFACAGLFGGVGIYLILRNLRGEAGEYQRVMKLKYFASLTFSIFVATTLILIRS